MIELKKKNSFYFKTSTVSLDQHCKSSLKLKKKRANNRDW